MYLFQNLSMPPLHAGFPEDSKHFQETLTKLWMSSTTPLLSNSNLLAGRSQTAIPSSFLSVASKTENSSIADLRIKAKKHQEALGIKDIEAEKN